MAMAPLFSLDKSLQRRHASIVGLAKHSYQRASLDVLIATAVSSAPPRHKQRHVPSVRPENSPIRRRHCSAKIANPVSIQLVWSILPVGRGRILTVLPLQRPTTPAVGLWRFQATPIGISASEARFRIAKLGAI
jgi:hypothetical protein